MGDITEFNLDDPSQVQREEDRLINEYNAGFPKRGDKLFVETHSSVPLDPLGLSHSLQPETRPVTGRRELYSRGYLLAGDRIVESLTGAPWEDALIYPVLFLYRHHVELELKALVSYSVNWLPDPAGADSDKKLAELKKTHTLKELWELLQQTFPKWNEGQSHESQMAFEGLLLELNDHDPFGQAARYETDRKGTQTLTSLSSVDLSVLKAGIHKISNYLGLMYEAIHQEVERR